MIRDYYELTKPGIIYGNALTLITGFLLARRIYPNHYTGFGLLLATLIGLSLIIASGCVANNYIDRDIDGKMERTKQRPSVRGVISLRNALIFATVLGLGGLILLILFTNRITTLIALGGAIIYVAVYTPLKRCSPWSVVVGSISGAVPPLVGYCALSNHIDAAAVILFFILVLWQIPHFYAIALYRLRDYEAAHVPILPLVRGIEATKIQSLFYIIAFTVATLMLAVDGYAGYVYLCIVIILDVVWFELSVYDLRIKKSEEQGRRYARKLFLFSLIVLVGICLTISIGSVV